MRKKYLSALLFGALLFASTGTFTSCKDYDDDIKNLQGEIDGTEASLTEKLTAVETSIANLQSAQSTMQAAIDAAQQAADDAKAAAAQAEANAIAAAAEQLESVKAELTELISQGDNALQSDIDAINATIATINGQIETLTAAVSQNTEAVAALQEANVSLTQSIAGLEEQVKANATAIGNLQAGLQTQADALKAYQESNDADVAGVLADVEELQAKIAELAGSEDLGTLQEQIDAIKAECQTLSSEIDRINGVTNMLFFAWYEGITGVSLVISDATKYNAGNLELLSAEAIADNTFGEELKDNDLFSPIAGAPMTFTAGERTKLEASFLMRVFPTTAVPQKEDIKLINSVGEDLVSTGQVEVVKVEKNTEVLTRAAANTGLWKVTLRVGSEYTDQEFDAMTTRVKGNRVEYPLFAVAIEDSRASVEGQALRSVVSEYNLTFANNAEAAKDRLNFTVNDKNVAYIYNRATWNKEVVGGATDILPDEYVWKNGAQAKPIWEGGLKNVMTSDDRSGYEYLEVTSKDAITIQLSDGVLKSAVAYYIVMDKNCAVSSDESEIRAWNSIESSIEGINKMYYTNTDKGEATITFTEDVNDIIGFRVYAVNANGTLVDPDGRSFYVKVGKAVQATASVNATVIPFISAPNAATVIANIKDMDAVKELLDADKYYSIEFAIDDVFKYHQNDLQGNHTSCGNAFGWTMLNSKNAPIGVDFNNTWDENATSKVATVGDFLGSTLSQAAKFKLTLNSAAEWIDYTDDKTYTGKLTIKDANNNAVATIDVTFAKQLPTATQLPDGFQWKANQINEGVYACYLDPETWDSYDPASEGSRKMDQIFTFGKVGETYESDKYVITFSTKDGILNENTIKNHANIGNASITIDKKNIDNTTQYDAVVAYNYGKISSVNPNSDFIAQNTYKVTYNCYYDSQYTWTLDSKVWDGKIPYGSDFTLYTGDKKDVYTHIDQAIKGTSAYDGLFNAYLHDVTPYADDEVAVHIKAAKVISNATGNADYFNVTIKEDNNNLCDHITGFTLKANTSNPTADVPSTLVITTVDMYGHENVINIPVTVTKR